MSLARSSGIAAVLLTLGAGFYYYAFQTSPNRWYADARSNSIHVLAAAQSEVELKEAVKPYGLFVRAKDGSWVAIRYRDTHSGFVRSVAVARDSGGQWFTCSRHFCGWLRSFAERRADTDAEMLRRMFPARAGTNGPVGHELMEALFSAADLAGLREALKQMDFQVISVK